MAIRLSAAFNGLLFSVALATAPASFAESYSGLVVGVADGDTVTVLDGANQQHKVRLSGIDAPERAQAFGNVSRQNLAQLVFKKQVTIEFEKLDRYRREVGKILLAGRDVNLQQIEAGLAWHYKKYQSEQPPADRPTYSAAESYAATERRGLWRDPSPTPPWEFRKSKRVRIPAQAGHGFRSNLDSDSSGSWSAIPRKAGQLDDVASDAGSLPHISPDNSS